jgi:hypothetical protein
MIVIRDGRRATQMDLDPIAGAEIQQNTAQEGTETSLLDASRAIPSPDWFSVPWSAILCLMGFRVELVVQDSGRLGLARVIVFLSLRRGQDDVSRGDCAGVIAVRASGVGSVQ